MRVFYGFFPSPLIDRLGWTLLHSLWQAAIVAVCLKMLLLLARKRSAQTRYFVSCAAMLAVVACPILTFLSIPSNPAARQTDPPVAIERTSIADAPSLEAPRPLLVAAQPFEPRRELIVAREPNLATTSQLEPLVAPVKFQHRVLALLSSTMPWTVLAWAVGVLALSIWNVGGWLAVQQLKFLHTRPAGPAARQLLANLASRLNLQRRIRLMESALAQTPLVIGIFRPIILVPMSVMSDLPVAELESILAHELAHILRRDYLVNLLQSIVETLLFYHPAVWWISRQIRTEREHCCDDFAVTITRDRATYVRALAAVASVRVPALAPAAAGGKLLPRLRRILGVAEVESRRSPRWLAGVLVMICLLMAGALRFQWDEQAQAQSKLSALAADPAGDLVRVHGVVIDPSGKPQGGVNVVAVASAWQLSAPLSQTRSGADGTFDISYRKSQFVGDAIGGAQYVSVAASAPGFGPAWERWDQVDPAGNIVLQLAPDEVPIEGRILDLEGRPVKGASVRVHHISAKAIDLKSLNINESSDFSYLSKPPTLPLPGFVAVSQPIITGEDGRFRISGVGSNRTASIQVTGPGIAYGELNVVTRLQETESRDFQSYVQVRRTAYGAKFDFTADPDRVITGTVRDAQTGQPLAGVTIQPDNGRLGRPNPGIRAVTDAMGHYRLEGLFKGKQLVVTAIPSDEQCYFMRDIEIPDAEGWAPVTIDFDLHHGVWITGKVTDLVTGEPVAGTRINYLPYISNAFVAKLPEFQRKPSAPLRIPGLQTRYNSKVDGTYRIVAAPGPAIVTAWCTTASYRMGFGSDQIKCPKSSNGNHFDTYDPWAWPNHPNAMKEVDIADGAQKDVPLDFQLDPGIRIHLTMTDGDGHPLTGVAAYRDRPGFSYQIRNTAEFDALAFRPDEKRTLWFWYMPAKLAKVITISPADVPTHEMSVKLEPIATVTGRLIGLDGQPLANALVQIGMDSPPAGTDLEGRFSLMVPPGREVHLSGIKGREEFDTDIQKLVIQPGEIKNVGDVQYKKY